MGAKFVCTTSTIYKQGERKVLQHNFTPCIVDVHPYKNISLTHYRVSRKTFKFVPVILKAHAGRANVCAHRKSMKPCNSKKIGAFYRGMICSCAPRLKFFSTPPDGASTEYQISNRVFSDFLRTYYCDFL